MMGFKWPIGKTVGGEATPVGVKDKDGLFAHLTLDATNRLPVSVSGAGSGGTSSNFGDPFPVAGTAAGAREPGGNMQQLALDALGGLKVSIISGGGAGTPPSTCTMTSVVANAATVTLLAANAARLGGTLHNDADKICRVKFGAAASATSYQKVLAPGEFYELPRPAYTGRIDAIWDAAPTGNMRIGEMT